MFIFYRHLLMSTANFQATGEETALRWAKFVLKWHYLMTPHEVTKAENIFARFLFSQDLQSKEDAKHMRSNRIRAQKSSGQRYMLRQN